MSSKYVLAAHLTKQILLCSLKKPKRDSIFKGTDKCTNQQIQQKADTSGQIQEKWQPRVHQGLADSSDILGVVGHSARQFAAGVHLSRHEARRRGIIQHVPCPVMCVGI